MNLALADPFAIAQDYPETTTGHLFNGHACALRFNRKGDFLAAGRIDGVVVIFDVETHSVATKLKGHIRQIQSLSWSQCGRYLLTSAQDWKCIIWDLKDDTMLRVVKFEAAVYMAELHPTDQYDKLALKTVNSLLICFLV
jgi:COMPASS component SWD1